MTGGPVNQRKTVKQERGCEGTQKEVLQPPFNGPCARAPEGRNTVHAETHGLQSQKERQRVPRRRERHRSKHRQNRRTWNSPRSRPVFGQIASREQCRQRSASAQKHRGIKRQSVDQEPRRQRPSFGLRGPVPEPHSGRKQGRSEEDRKRAECKSPLFGRQGIGQHQAERSQTDRQEWRQHDRQVHGRLLTGAAPECHGAPEIRT